eukprot:6182163-Pleurochrysis_carterae.AAC.3
MFHSLSRDDEKPVIYQAVRWRVTYGRKGLQAVSNGVASNVSLLAVGEPQNRQYAAVAWGALRCCCESDRLGCCDAALNAAARVT